METLFPIQYSYLIPLLPLLGAVIAGFFGAKILRGQSHWPIWIGVGLSAILSISLMTKMLGLWHEEPQTQVTGVEVIPHEDRGPTETTDYQHRKPDPYYNQDFFNWISAGDFNVTAGFYFDALTAVMLCVVTGIGFFITVFAAGYMKGEAGYFRFFAYLGLFIFMMTMLVMGNNLVMLYLGWEGVGLCSYLLIGYYYDKPSAREAAKKAFLVNRVGDFGFGLGIMLCFLAFGTIKYFDGGQGLLELAMNPNHPGAWALKYIPFLLMMGAFGKSAQFPLHVWLPDAMEGPTPVSALIHAATMVTAGVYMIVRCGTLFFGNHAAMMTIAGIGMFTALFAATIALRQFDLKKIFAYSTVSQLGFMFVAVGCLAPVAGVFHLVTHAFFKALLFLSSGVVMHAMAGELDLRKMSGLKRVLPITRWMMLIGCAALAGFPFLSGFFSKDEIVAAAWIQNRFLGLLLLFVAFLTAYYSFRLYFRVFTGPEIIPPPPNPHRPDVDEHIATDDAHHGHGHADHHHNHEPATMMLPLIVLAIGAIAAGYLNFPERERSLAGFLSTSPSLRGSYTIATRPENAQGHIIPPLAFGRFDVQEDYEHADPDYVHKEHSLHRSLMFVSGMVSILGIYLAYVLHRKRRSYADELAAQFRPITRVLEAKYWIDEIYDAAIVQPLRDLGRLLYAFDRFIIDGLVGVIGLVPQLSGFALKLSTQRGYLQGYAVTMLFGIVVILLIVFI